MNAPRPPRRRLGSPVNPPIERASTLRAAKASDLYRGDGVVYGRGGLAVHDAVIDEFTRLEGGAGAVLAPSGLAAVALAFQALTKAGDHVLVADNVYAPTRKLVEAAGRFGLSADFFDPRAGAGELEARFGSRTRLVILESPGSLTFELHDTPAITAIARRKGALSLMDGTWSAGVFSKPLALGCDAVIHSATKFASGGSDVFLGAVVAGDEAVLTRLESFARLTGAAASPDDAYAVLRGLRSLDVRLERHQASGLAIAQWLSEREEVARVIHPARPDHPDHAIWRRDFTGSSGVFACVLKPCAPEQESAFLDALSVFGLGFSYGGFESLVIPSAPQLRRTAKPVMFEGPLLRFAVGLEPLDTLIEDLERGFAAFIAAAPGA